jgi:hypothetical protein
MMLRRGALVIVFVLVGPCEVLLCVAWRIDAVED